MDFDERRAARARWGRSHYPSSAPAPAPATTSALVDVRVPASIPKLLAVVLGCALFVGVLLYVLGSAPTPVEVVVAVVGVAFFGLGGMWALARQLGTGHSLVLTPEGLRPVAGGLVPWQDIERVGVGTIARATTVIGLRLTSYDAYIASLSPTQVRRALRGQSTARSFGSVVGSSRGARGAGASLANIPDARHGMAGALAWARDHSAGFDLSFSPLLFRGAAAQVAATIDRYREAWMAERASGGGSSR